MDSVGGTIRRGGFRDAAALLIAIRAVSYTSALLQIGDWSGIAAVEFYGLD